MHKIIESDLSVGPFTREHHHILLFCYRMREGFRKGISLGRIKSYSDWFYKTFMLPHFESEEKHLFPLLGEDHPVIVKALAEHRRLKRLFTDQKDVERSLHRLEEELDRHTI